MDPDVPEIDAAATVLLAEDDPELTAELTEALRSHGLACDAVADWAGLLTRLAAPPPPDILLLDQRLGPVDVLVHLPALRRRVPQPIVILTGNPREIDRSLGLELGADDFLLKPIGGRELVARLRARLRGRPAPPPPPIAAALPGWRLLEADGVLLRPDGGAVPLGAAEFAFLRVLAARPGAPVPRAELARAVFQRRREADLRALDSLAYALRRTLEAEGLAGCILTIRNRGYAFAGFPRG